MAQLEYRYQVNTWDAKGIPFKKHLYVPEVHPETGKLFCECEDEHHVFRYVKVKYTCNVLYFYDV